MPERDTERTTQDDGRMFDAALVITAAASAVHPEGAVLPTAADTSPQEN